METETFHQATRRIWPHSNFLYVSSLGATPLMELMIAAGKAVAQLQLEHGMATEHIYIYIVFS
jgi:dihydroxyacetone kinase